MISISTVIPTRNRIDSLQRCLKSIGNQIFLPEEVIIVDSSDVKLDLHTLLESVDNLNIKLIHSTPSVCKQRNVGIAAAQNDWIFLCDDDIDLPENYLSTLVNYLEVNESCQVVAGRLVQLENGNWVDQYPIRRQIDLLWRFIFQLSVWSDLSKMNSGFLTKQLGKWYHERSNDVSLAGWPILTQWNDGVNRTSIYPLGASLISKEWLIDSPFDEVLDPHGIGDNYGVAINFPQPKSIHVLSETYAKHHRNLENRLEQALAYYRRTLALHYFLKKKENSVSRTCWFVWSLFGNSLYFLFKGKMEMFKATNVALFKIISNRNPYWKGFLRNEESIKPNF